MNGLNVPIAEDGGSVLNIGETTTGGDVHVFARAVGGLAKGGYSCRSGADFIWLNTSLNTSQRGTRHTAAHEMLHALNAEHGGQEDSWFGVTDKTPLSPKHSTCFDPVMEGYNSVDPTPDDRAYINWLYGRSAHDGAAWSPMTADSGFEGELMSEWIFWNGLIRSLGSGSNAFEGNHWMSIRPTDTTQYIQQHTLVHNGAGSDIANESYRGRARVREWVPAADTDMIVEAWKRIKVFSGSNTCDYSLGMDSYDPNDKPSTGTWVKASSVPYNNLSSNGYRSLITGSFNINGKKAADVAVRLKGTSKQGGSFRWILVDNLAIEGTGS